MRFFVHLLTAEPDNASGKKYRSDSYFALRCAFWVWLLSLSGRFAVDTKTCSTALLQAHSAMTRILFNGKGRSFVLAPPLIHKGRLGGVIRKLFFCRTSVRLSGSFFNCRTRRRPFTKNIGLILALHFRAPFGYGSFRCRAVSQ